MKNVIYMLVVDVWRLAAKYKFRKMGDAEWEDFINTGQKLVIRYWAQGEAVERLCRDLLDAFQTFMSGSEKGGRGIAK